MYLLRTGWLFLALLTLSTLPLSADTQTITRQIGTADGFTTQWGPGFLYKLMTPAVTEANPTTMVRASVIFKAGNATVTDAAKAGVFSGDGKGAMNYTNGLFYVSFTSAPTAGTPITVTFTYNGAPEASPPPANPPQEPPAAPTPPVTPPETPPVNPAPPQEPPANPPPPSTPTPPTSPPQQPPASPTPPPQEPTKPTRLPVTPKNVSDVLSSIVQQYKIVGMAAVVVHDDQIVMQGVAGMRDGSTPLTINDKFHLGSDTKAMTATLIATLVRDGIVSWDTLVKDVFPELVSSGKMNSAYYKLTLKQLLMHRGGMPTDASYTTFKNAAPTDVVQQRQLLTESVLSQNPSPAIGVYSYSNVGYILAAHVAEKLTGKSWEVLLKERVMAPLGISSMGYGSPETPGQLDQPIGHTADGVRKPGVDNLPIMGPSSRVHMTLQDWAIFANTHLQGARGETQLLDWYSYKGVSPLLSKSLFDAMQEPMENIAMGWGVSGSGDARTFIHSGSNTLWYALAWLETVPDSVILIGVNQGGANAYNAMLTARERLATLLQQQQQQQP